MGGLGHLPTLRRHTPLSWQTYITRVEVAAALAARQRAGTGLTMGERDALVRLLARHTTTEYHAIAMSVALMDRAMHLTQRHRLRGYDAVQLATALTTSILLPRVDLCGS